MIKKIIAISLVLILTSCGGGKNIKCHTTTSPDGSSSGACVEMVN